MSDFAAKFRRIILPYFLIALVVIGLYTFLHWCFVIRHRAILIDNKITEIFIPLALTGLLVLVFLRKRIKYLILVKRNSRHDPVFIRGFIAFLSIGFPATLIQNYVKEATGGLTKLDHITQLKQHPITKYYTLKRSFVNKDGVKVLYNSNVVRKSKYSNEKYYEMEFYFCMPIYDDASQIYIDSGYIDVPEPYRRATFILNGKKIKHDDLKNIRPAAIKGFQMLYPEYALKTYKEDSVVLVLLNKGQYPWKPKRTEQNAPIAWIAFKYEERIDNDLLDEEKDQRKKDFFDRSLNELKSKRLDGFTYLDRISYGSDYRKYVAAIGGEKQEWSSLIFTPVYESFENRGGFKLLIATGIFTAGSLIFILMVGYKRLRVPYR